MASLAQRAGKDTDAQTYRSLAAKMTAAIETKLVDGNGVLAGSVERLASGKNYRDGSTIEALTWNLIAPTDRIATATLAGLSALRTPVGGYQRVEGSSDPYDTNEWVFLDLRASDAFRRAGNAARADELLAAVTSRAAAQHDLLPELYNTQAAAGPLGDYAGSIPMVGYGAGTFQHTMLDRAGLLEQTDCGEPTGGDDAGTTSEPEATAAGCACDSGDGPDGTSVVVMLVVLASCRHGRVRLRHHRHR
jgi:GH15 family glucan-1,4-alpha-glucosidase